MITTDKIKVEVKEEKQDQKPKKVNRLTFLKFDYLLLFFATIITVFSLFIVSLIEPPKGNTVEILYNGNVTIRESLDINKKITLTKAKYPNLLGDMEIEIEVGKVRISKETSPNNICSKQGWTDNQFKSLICEPNNVIVRIITDKDFTIPGDIIAGDV